MPTVFNLGKEYGIHLKNRISRKMLADTPEMRVALMRLEFGQGNGWRYPRGMKSFTELKLMC